MEAGGEQVALASAAETRIEANLPARAIHIDERFGLRSIAEAPHHGLWRRRSFQQALLSKPESHD
jgi:myo-inositol catabolism protein IolC